jgi:hypothetical protein
VLVLWTVRARRPGCPRSTQRICRNVCSGVTWSLCTMDCTCLGTGRSVVLTREVAKLHKFLCDFMDRLQVPNLFRAGTVWFGGVSCPDLRANPDTSQTCSRIKSSIYDDSEGPVRRPKEMVNGSQSNFASKHWKWTLHFNWDEASAQTKNTSTNQWYHDYKIFLILTWDQQNK